MMERMLMEYLLNSLWQAPLLALGAWLVLRAGQPGPRVQHGVWVAALALMVAMPLLSLRGMGPAMRGESGATVEVAAASVPLPVPTAVSDEVDAGVRSRVRARRPVVGFYSAPAAVQWTRGVDRAAAAAGAAQASGAAKASSSQSATGGREQSASRWLRMRELRLSAAATHWVVELYLAVVAFAMMRLLWNWMVARRMAAEATPAELSAEELALFDACCERLRVRRPRVLVSARTASPLVVGVLRPALLLPERVSAEYSGRELEAVWWHELAHVSRRDYLANLLCRIGALPVAYHPATHAVERRVRQTREMVCDRMAAEQMHSPVGYARCLVRLAQQMQAGEVFAAQMVGVGMGLDLLGTGVLEERVKELIETRAAMGVGVRAMRLAGSLAMVLAVVGAAAIFHVTPTMAQAGAAAARADGLVLPIAARAAIHAPMVAPEPIAAELAEMLPMERVVPVPLAGSGAEAQAAPASGRVVILFLDGLSMSPEEQARMKQSVLNYVDKTMVPGTRVAVFGLWDKLGMTQDFTSDVATLDAAVNSTIAGFDSQQSGLRAALTDEERQRMKLEALAQIPEYVAGVDGRKAVLFFTSGPATYGGSELEEMLRKTVSMLAAAQISVYAVDVRGLAPLAAVQGPPQASIREAAVFPVTPVMTMAQAPAQTAQAAEPQIRLKVRFASYDRTLARQLGINLFSLGAANSIGSVTTQQFSPPSSTCIHGAVASPAVATVPDPLDLFIFRPDLNLGATIEALQTQQVVQVLSEPNLLIANGKEGSFLAGGQYPFPVFQGATGPCAVTIQFKEFGVRLNLIPTITPRGSIRLQVAPEVSSIDFANGVTTSGFTVPGLDVRKAKTEVELSQGQSFAIGGLLDSRSAGNFSKIRSLGDIPVLGKFFQSANIGKTDTELIVIVTPEIVQPIPVGAPLPQVKTPARAAVREVSYQGAEAPARTGAGQAPAVGGSPVSVPAATMASNLIHRPDPVYPPIAKAAHVQGSVVLDAVISKTGMVEKLSALSGPAMLQGSALQAVRQWTYRPYLLNGAPAEVETTITVNFTFGDRGGLQTLDGVTQRTAAALAQAAEEYRNLINYYPDSPDAAKARARLAEIVAMQKEVGGGVPSPGNIAAGSVAADRRVPSSAMAELLVSRPDPTYPAEAKAAHVQGAVVLDAVISKEGTIESLRVVSGPEMLQASALDAVRRWTYRPYLVDGAPVEVETTITVNFTFGL